MTFNIHRAVVRVHLSYLRTHSLELHTIRQCLNEINNNNNDDKKKITYIMLAMNLFIIIVFNSHSSNMETIITIFLVKICWFKKITLHQKNYP